MIRTRAPELPQLAPWLNCDGSLSLRALRGKVVLLDFWTYGCINCLHILPDLHYLEAKYRERLVIIGIHTAKFEQEQNPEAVQQAIWRYGITHPVVVDCDRTLWDQYAIKAWPTFVVIDPQGYAIATLAGEGQRERLERLIEGVIGNPSGAGAEQENDDANSGQPWLASPLAFPGKVVVDGPGDRLFIADTEHHRIVVTTLAGVHWAAIGTGTAGWQDGEGATAQFSSPQGVAFDAQRQILYVADTGNHLLRRVNLLQSQVSTLAGTGTQSRVIFPHGGAALSVALNSPWDVALLGESLYIAMAGAHQIWQMDLARGTLQTLIGTGAEFCVDGDRQIAAFAQPSGITTDGTELFVADSETSSIRAISLAGEPLVRTVCGGGQLFEFGNQDGVGSEARLQHCLGITYGGGYLWVADTYNHAIKRVDCATEECMTICGSGQAGFEEGTGRAASFAEPSGLGWWGNGQEPTGKGQQLFVADTNNHAIRCIQIASQGVTTLPLSQVCSPFICVPER